MNQHKKGLSAREIGRLFNMDNATVSRTVIDALSKNGESPKLLTPESEGA